MDEKKIIHCFGDSHVLFFKKLAKYLRLRQYKVKEKEVNIHFLADYVGSALAYNLCKKNTSTKAREKIFDIIKKRVPVKNRVMFVFGEIDCRVHLAKRIIVKKENMKSVVLECVDRYFSFIREVKNLNYEILVFGAVATTIHEDTYFPKYGTCRERNKITKLFNQYLEDSCKKEDMIFVSIFDKLINKNNITKWKFYCDNAHIGPKAFPLIIKEFEKKVEDFIN